jgi:large subunit ribosomal protein L15
MMIHEITEQVGKYKARKRVGRGRGSGRGKTSGRGHKGAGSRAGFRHRFGYEGGQMPLTRRLPKRGFSNAPFRNEYHIVNVKVLEQRIDDGSEVNVQTLAEAGIVRDTSRPLKVLGEGELTKKFIVTAAKFSAAARSKIESAGGSVTEERRTKWRRDRTKKKPVRSGRTAGSAAADTPATSAKSEST